jgi:hypothetical protein
MLEKESREQFMFKDYRSKQEMLKEVTSGAAYQEERIRPLVSQLIETMREPKFMLVYEHGSCTLE